MREVLLNFMINNIRYPNLITYYFMDLIFTIFEADDDII